jgi:hypothetical protein
MNKANHLAINSEEELFEVIKQIHFDAYKLCRKVFGRYFENSGNMGVFCHFADEYEKLNKIREKLTQPSDNPNQKYFKLIKPITIPKDGDFPETKYLFLYIRKPDPTSYGNFTGDVDFYVEDKEYEKLIDLVGKGNVEGAQLYDQQGVGTLVQMSSANIGAVAYISTRDTTEKVRIKQPNK